MTNRHILLEHMSRTLILIACCLIAGCTSVQVQPLSLAGPSICIEENPKVQVDDFLSVLQQGFSRHGIISEVYQKIPQEQCSQVVTYTARRSWDFTPYLSSASIRILDQQSRSVASADYHLRGKGGFSLLKWQGTKTKMDPVIDLLLVNVAIQRAPTVPVKPDSPREESIDQQLKTLQAEKLDYAEYQRRYRLIMQHGAQ